MTDIAQTNLRPYGVPVVGTLAHPVWPVDYQAAAIARAQYKRTAPDPDSPLTRDPRLGLNFVLVLGFSAVLGLGIVYLASVSRSGGPPPGLIWAVFMVFGIFRTYQAWAESDGHTQVGAVRAWTAAIRAGKWERLDRLRLAADRDGFPRILPGEGPSDAFPIGAPGDLRRYWTDLLTNNQLNRGQWFVTKAKTQPVGPDISLVTFRLAVARGLARVALLLLLLVIAGGLVTFVFTWSTNESRDLMVAVPFLLLPVLVVALILASRRRVFEMSKLVVWRNGRWRIFNGEWQGPEDRDLRWIHAHPAEYAPPPPQTSNLGPVPY